MQPPTLVQGLIRYGAAVTVDRVDQIADNPAELFRRVLPGDIDKLGLDLGYRPGAFRRVRGRDHERVTGRDLPMTERGRHLGKFFELSG